MTKNHRIQKILVSSMPCHNLIADLFNNVSADAACKRLNELVERAKNEFPEDFYHKFVLVGCWDEQPHSGDEEPYVELQTYRRETDREYEVRQQQALKDAAAKREKRVLEKSKLEEKERKDYERLHAKYGKKESK